MASAKTEIVTRLIIIRASDALLGSSWISLTSINDAMYATTAITEIRSSKLLGLNVSLAAYLIDELKCLTKDLVIKIDMSTAGTNAIMT